MIGHGPGDMCLDCYLAEQKDVWRDNKMPRKARAFLMLADGYTQTEVAAVVGVAVRTLYRWLNVLKKSVKMQKWVSELAASHV
jgi:DNA invertase Pin-like site-specific DNA recombinase